MKDVLKTLATQKEEVQKEFDALEATRKQLLETSQKLQQELSQVVTRQIQAQGKFQLLEQQERDFQDEPKGE